MLTNELERQLIELRGASKVGDRLLLRTASTPPTNEASRTVLSTTSSELRWGYYSNGDYDQNSEVNVADITPIALHFLESDLPFGFPPDSIQAVIDGDGNGEINVADITPIVMNFYHTVINYKLYRSQDSADYPASPGDGNGDATLLASLPLNSATGYPDETRLQFTNPLPNDSNRDYFWVRPVDNEGAEGIASNRAGPITRVYTLDGHIFMAGGGTDPLPGVPVDLSQDSTIIASTVTDVNGHYSFDDLPSGNYTVTPTGDPYGYSPVSMDVTIEGADKYLSPIYPAPVDIVHTWVAEENENISVLDMAFDDENNVYVSGNTQVGGESGDELVFVLKYDLFGNLLWRSTKQFGTAPWVEKILLDPAGNIYLGGSYTTAPDVEFNRRFDDIYVLKLDSSGDEQWLFTHSSIIPLATEYSRSHHDALRGMAFDTQGNLVLMGDFEDLTGKPIVLLTVNPDGALLEEKYLSTEGNLIFEDVQIDSLGNTYLGGDLWRSPEHPALLMKIDPGGNLAWVNKWGSEFNMADTKDLVLGQDGSVFAASEISLETGGLLRDSHLARITPDGSVSWEVQVSRGNKLSNPDVAIGPMGKLWLSQSEGFDNELPGYNTVPFLLSFDQNGNLRFVRRWYDAENFNRGRITDIEVNSFGVAMMCGVKGNQVGVWEIPEVTLDYLPKEQSTQAIIPYDTVGIVDSIVVVTPLDITGEEDSEVYEHQALVMWYRP